MNEIEKRLYLINLYNIYNSLLSKTQKDVLNQYLIFDLSLAEIAQNKNISRSAVEDAIKKGEKKLYYYEKNLNIAKNNEELGKIIAKLKENTKELNLDNEVKLLERIINNGI